MNIGDIPSESLNSVRQALTVSALRKSMNQDKSTAAALIQGMEQANAAVMEQSVTPHKGGNIDVRV